LKNVGADSVVYYLKASFHREDVIVFEENHFFLFDHSEKFSSEK